ncbi:MAG: MFS transporter [Chloroflexota bacterium]
MLNPMSALRELRGPLAVLASMLFVSQLGIGVMLPIIPLYAMTLGASPRDLGLLTTAFSLANVAAQLGIGFVLDRVDTRIPIRAGIATYAGANLLISTASGVGPLLAYRALAGLGAGANLVADRVYLSKFADPARLAYLNGLLASAASAGALMGPAIGGLLAQVADLRAPFVVVGLTSGIAFLASLRLPRVPQATTDAGAIVTSSFNRSVIVLLIANTFLLSSFGGFITTFAPFATVAFAWSTAEVGIVFSVFAAGSIVFAAPLGGLADRRGRRLVGTYATVPVFFLGLALALAMPRPVIYAFAFLAGGGISAFSACWFALLTEASPEARRGRTFGIVNAISTLGVVIGANGAAAIWESSDIRIALALTGLMAMIGGLMLNLLPPGIRPAASPAPRAPEASDTPAAR